MASSKGLGADPAYRRLIDLAEGSGDVDLVKGMEHLSHNSRLDKDFVVYDGTSVVGRAAFQALGLPREGITVHQALVRVHDYADSRGGRGYQEFADELSRYLGLAEGSTPTEAEETVPTARIGPAERSPDEAGAVVDINQHRIDYIERRLPVSAASRIGSATAKGGALIVPTHVAVVRHAAWIPWTPGATWGYRTRWGDKIPLGLVSEGQIRLDVARALAAHNASELVDLAAHPGWEWVANVMPPMSGDTATASVPSGGDFGDHEGERRPSIPDLDGGQAQASGSPNTGMAPYAGASSQHEGLRVKVVPPEASNVLEYRTTPTAGESARRSESLLVKEFERWLVMKGHEVGRAQIRPIGENAPLVTDTYDVTTGVLYEAKSSADRATIRLGVGQLLDYLRFLPGVKGSLLLPSDPSHDLCSFIFSCGFSVTYPQGSSWVTDESW